MNLLLLLSANNINLFYVLTISNKNFFPLFNKLLIIYFLTTDTL